MAARFGRETGGHVRGNRAADREHEQQRRGPEHPAEQGLQRGKREMRFEPDQPPERDRPVAPADADDDRARKQIRALRYAQRTDPHEIARTAFTIR